MNIIELILFFGMIISVLGMMVKSKKQTKKFGDGLLMDIDSIECKK